MEPRSREERIRHTFDAFCKKVLRNEARDYLDELARRRSREVSFSELPVEVMNGMAVKLYRSLLQCFPKSPPHWRVDDFSMRFHVGQYESGDLLAWVG